MRTVARVIPMVKAMEGDGVTIQRAFPVMDIDSIDPFLLLDHFGPVELKPGKAAGFPPHPHKGFETVTYLLEGEFEHKDSFGNQGLLTPGSVQWMTAGSGLVHSEMPRAGRVEGFQLWVNLPKARKSVPPAYQELPNSGIPVAAAPGVRAKVIAGEALGVKAAIGTHTPISYVHFTLEPGASVDQPAPKSANAFAYDIGSGEVRVFAHDGDTVHLENTTSKAIDVLFLSGEPLNEPVARHGPFVMNTREELYQAFVEYRDGKMGTLEA